MRFQFLIRSVLLSFLTIAATASVAWSSEFAEDPTRGKPFFPWIWDDQIVPTAREAADVDGLSILLSTTIATIVARQYDGDVRAEYGDNRRMPPNLSRLGSSAGSGYPEIAITIGELLWDQPQGLRMARAVLFTSASHITIATLAGRERPNGGPRSFPSGHTSTAFAVAGSLAYSYGPWIGVPALAVATFVGASRIADNAHWLSDTVAAAGLGIFWARASAHAGLVKGSVAQAWSPGLVPGGATINFSKEF